MRLAPDRSVVAWLDEKPAMDLFISAVTKAEIELGISLLPNGKRKSRLAVAAEDIFNEFPQRCLPFDALAATRYAELVSHRTQSGRPITVEDAQIAAIALVHGLVLATRNSADFEEIDGMRMVNPWRQT